MNRNINGLWPYVRKVADIIALLGTSRNSSCLFQLESDSERVRWKKFQVGTVSVQYFLLATKVGVIACILALKSTGKQYDISIFEKLGILKNGFQWMVMDWL